MNKSLKRVIVSAMALSLLVPAVSAPKAEAQQTKAECEKR